MSSVTVPVAKPPMSSSALRRITAQLPQKKAEFQQSLPRWMTRKNSVCSVHTATAAGRQRCWNESRL